MLSIVVSGEEFFDEVTQEFSSVGDVILELEHSLLSVSKWESIHCKPFLGPKEKTPEEVLSYIEMMVVSGNFSLEVISRLEKKQIEEINDYIGTTRSATTFGASPQGSRRRGQEVITSELIYYWMTAMNIPFECETWHLSRLFALIRISNVKNSKPQKVPARQAAAERRALNAQRRAELNTSG